MHVATQPAAGDGSGGRFDRGFSRRRALTTAVGLAAAVLPATAAGCGNDGGTTAAAERVELDVFWWGGPERAEITARALDLYTKKHPNVTFKTQWQAFNGYYDKLANRVASGEAPDIFQIDDQALTDYAVRSVAADLSGYIGPKKQIDESRFPPSLAAYGNVNGKPFGVPAAENTAAMVYDRTVVHDLGVAEPQIGWSYEQLIDWAAEITAKSGGKVYGTTDPSAVIPVLWLWLRAQGRELYANGRLAVTADDCQRWFELWAGARSRNATPPPEITAAANTNEVGKQLVVTRQGATTFGWSNQLAEYQKGTDHELGITAYPGDPKGQWARASMFWSIYQGSKHAAAAASVIGFLGNDPEVGKILGTERGIPANLDVRSQIAPSLPAAMQTIVRFENDIATRFGQAPAAPPKGHNQVRQLLIKAAESVQWGRATPRRAAEEFVIQAQPVLGG